MGNLLSNCVKVCEAIELPFGVVSGVVSGIGVLDGNSHLLMGRFWGFFLFTVCNGFL